MLEGPFDANEALVVLGSVLLGEGALLEDLVTAVLYVLGSVLLGEDA